MINLNLLPLDARPTFAAGSRFGFLVAERKVDTQRWEFRCDCGKLTVSRQHDVVTGKIVSCGCYGRKRRAESNTKHGSLTGHRQTGKPVEYTTWLSIIARCENPNYVGFARYGGRGITVCARWRDNFSAFLEDMGERPSTYHSIDRKNNDMGYEPSNCRWATREEQANNTVRNVFVDYNGQRKTIAQWEHDAGFERPVIRTRLRLGWSFEKALNTPAKPRQYRTLTLNGRTQTLRQWCRELGLSPALVNRRLSLGWSHERTLTEPIQLEHSHGKH